MALKYVDIFATNNGDGTTKDQASGAGSTGAWNVIPFESAPAYGSISAGDTIYIRSKSGSTNATYTKGSNAAITWTSYSATGAAPITWVVDNGTIWTGDNGTLTIANYAGSSSVFTFAEYHYFVGTGVAGNQTCIFSDVYNGAVSAVFAIKNQNNFRNCKFTHSYTSTSSSISPYQLASNVSYLGDNWTRFTQCQFKVEKAGTTGIFKPSGGVALVEFNDCEFDVTSRSAAAAQLIIGIASYSVYIVFKGGKITGATSSWSVYNDYTTYEANPSYVKAFSFDLGSASPTTTYSASSYQTLSVVSLENIPGGKNNFVYSTPQGYVQWKSGDSYPYLNATCIDGTTGMSLKVWPNTDLCSVARPVMLQPLVVSHTSASATRTITVELLIKDTAAFATPQKNGWWMDGMYTDTGGLPVCFSTLTTGDLTTSTASWNTTSFGGATYVKYKLTYTTTTSILTGTDVYLYLKSSVPSGSSTDYYFVDPDVIIA